MARVFEVESTSAASGSPGSPLHCSPRSDPGASPATSVFPPGYLLQEVARQVFDAWAGVEDALPQHAHMKNYSSQATGRIRRDLLPVPFYPASEVWELVDPNKDGALAQGTRFSRFERLAAAGCHGSQLTTRCGAWAQSACLPALPSKTQAKDLTLLAGEVSQLFFKRKN